MSYPLSIYTMKKICLAAAILHLIIFFWIVLYVYFSNDGQASMVWIIFFIIDFPVSLVYLFAGAMYSQWFDGLDGTMFAQILYLPHFIHGILGTIWWYFLPKILMRTLTYLRR